MVKKRRNPGAEGTGCRPGDHFCDRERSRAWEVDLVVWCWLICHCAYVPGPRRPGPARCYLLHGRWICSGDEKHCNRSISRRGTSPFLRRAALNSGSEICHLLCGGEDDLRQSRSSSSVGGQVVQLTSSICVNKIVRSTLRD